MLIGQRIGHYELLAKLGEGGMGEVADATAGAERQAIAASLLIPDDEDNLATARRT